MSNLKIFINGKFLTQQVTGVQAYAYGMLDAMKRQGVSFEILAPKSAPLSDRYIVTKIGFFTNPNLWEQLSLAKYINQQENAILINFCNSAPLLCKNQIVTIHDLAFEQKNVKWFAVQFKYWYRFLIPKITRTSKFVFTVSKFSKNEMSSQYSISKEKIKVIPNGLNTRIQIGERKIAEDYVLLIGGSNPRKNTSYVIDKIDELTKLGLKLVVLKTEKSVFKDTIYLNHPSIIYFNYASNEEYYSLINYSKALIYPSLYEGFGIPILESLCLRTPVICSDLNVFKECFGELPIYFNTSDGNSFIYALQKVKETVISDIDVENLKRKYSFDQSVSLILKTLEEL